MDAVTYLKEKERMTDDCEIACKDCPLCNDDGDFSVCKATTNNPEEAVAIVEKWSKENPVVTIRDKLLEVFPDTPLKEDGTPKDFCPRDIGYADSYDGCDSCQECWSQPYVKKS